MYNQYEYCEQIIYNSSSKICYCQVIDAQIYRLPKYV